MLQLRSLELSRAIGGEISLETVPSVPKGTRLLQLWG